MIHSVSVWSQQPARSNVNEGRVCTARSFVLYTVWYIGYMLTPNTGRIIVELLKTGDKQGEIYLPERENVKAGENLLIGKVIHPGEPDPLLGAEQTEPVTKFKEGQIVMFQEYSMSGVYKDIKALVDGTVSISETMKPENQYHVVAEADIMASWDDTTEV